VEPSERLRADKVLREFFEYRFQSMDERLDRLTDAFDKLSTAIITKAAFDELSRDVIEAEERIRNLEEKVRLGRHVVIGMGIILGPLAIVKLQELFT
jgi:hypothetical protein